MAFEAGINNRKWQLILIPSFALLVTLAMSIKRYLISQNFFFSIQLFFILSIFIFSVWEVNLIIYRKLDRQIPFYESPQKRFISQLIYGFLATVSTFTSLYLLLTWARNGNVNVSNFLNYLVIASVISFIINAFYIFKYLQSAVYYREEIKTKDLNEKLAVLTESKTSKIASEITENPSKTIDSILIESGNKTFNVAFEDISYFNSSEGIVILIKKDGLKLTTNYNSFSYLTNRLPTQLFFQLNRQIIVHLQSIRSVTDDVNRKLTVQISAFPKAPNLETVKVSRYRNPEFKQWFAQQLSV
jgi:DNA-binding LytR/AlgR family response regulator